MPPKDWDNIRDGIAALLDRLIGNTGDTGGSQTAGTVMAKENAILKKIEDLTERQRMFSREQIWGHWTTLGNASGTVRVQYGETKSTTIKVPEGAWFAYLRTRVSSWTGAGGERHIQFCWQTALMWMANTGTIQQLIPGSMKWEDLRVVE